MLLHIDRKTYLIIAIGTAIFVFLVGTFFGQGIVDFVDAIPGRVAPSVTAVAEFIIGPIKFVMLNPIIGGILAGLLWPVSIAWVLLSFLLIVLTEIGKAGVDVDNQFQ